MIAIGLCGAALAGSGPWVVGEDGVTVFLGTETQRLGNLAIQSGPGQRDVVEVAEGITAFRVKAITTLGISNRVDVQLAVPWARIETPRPDAPLCATLGLGACDRTQGIGVIEARVKGLVLDEYFGAPISLAVGGDVRYGQFTAATRERVTNLGEGTFDVGPFVSLGRTGRLGKGGYVSAWTDLGYRYRVPNTDAFPALQGDTVVPGSEFTGAAELTFSPSTRFGFGPVVGGLYRPWGQDWYEVDLTDEDRFAALRVANVRVGAQAVIRGDTLALAVSFLQTVYGFNNPSDTFVVGVGVQFDGSLRREGDG